MKKITYILILLLSVSMAIKAQQTQPAQQAVINVSGTVIDALTGETLPGVTVVIKGKVGGSITDGDGNFAVKALRGEWVIFNYIGYKPFEYLVTGDIKGLKINLTEEVQQIDEVVVTAVGVQRKISTLAAISSVDSKDLQAPAPSITNLLGGRAAGVFTLQSSGEPGKNLAEFWVRGIGTFGANSSALVLIDGLEGDINSIDPADVESFSVLKDASATAVYGVRGANGVVLITTKRGQAGKLSITGRANYTLSHLRRLPEYLRAYDYALLANEAREVRGETPLYKKIYLDVIRDGLDPDFYPDISWQDEIINPLSFKQTYYVSGRGGGDISRYFVSLGGSSESAAYKVDKSNPYSTNAGYNTYSFRINLDIDLTKTTQLKFNSDAYLSVNDRPGNVTNTDDLWRWQAELTPLVFPIRYSNGDLPSLSSGNISPYVAINYFGKTKMTQYTSKFSMAVEQDLRFITEGLKLKILGAYDRNGGYIETRTYHPALYLAIGRNNYGELVTRETVAASTQESYTFYNNTGGYDQFRRLQFETTLNYDRVFNNDHRVGGLAYLHLSDQFSSQQSNESEMNGLSANYAQIPRRYLRLTGRLAYGYKDTYMIDFNFGYTGTENFMPGRQYGFFPAIALGWVPSSYDWVAENMSWVNMFKIRGSYGTVGNDRIGGRRFPYLNRVSQGEYSVWGGAVLPVITVARVGADNLVWERALKTDIGIDAQMFGNALTFTVDFFHDKRNGIFQERVQVPGYAGLTNNPYGNVGSMVSWGSDGTASYTFNINKDVGITLRGNYTYSQNKVLNYEKLYEEYPYKDYTGLPNNIVRGYQCEGFFKDEADILYSAKQNWGTVKPGDLKYKDINGDGVINDEDIVPISYQQMFPLLVYGFGGQVSYKDLSLGVLFKGTGKVDYFRNNTGYIPFNQNNLGNILTQFKDPSTRWIPLWYAQEHGIDPSLAENPNAQLPRLQYGGNSNNSQLSDFWKGDARYLRLQEVTLNYNVRHKLLQRAGIASLDLQLVGNNLYIWDKVKDFDPEQANRVGKVYPIPATYSFQLYINM
ncbi:MAG: TonB-dependent receptor [Tannerella sp.]|jgi:TonB-linked SusC/RagA family outer membrane protein|nr:TonB-dependent receptor [Tannerella sp.]